ncbi:MAG: hypothetical protein FWD76_03005 [Firmicutes bacterium]|nr:hypothetical protein [Bacillota bacterium]
MQVWTQAKSYALYKPGMIVSGFFGLVYSLGIVIWGSAAGSLYLGYTGVYGVVLGVSRLVGVWAACRGRERSPQIARCTLAVSVMHICLTLLFMFWYEEINLSRSLALLMVSIGAVLGRVVWSSVMMAWRRKQDNGVLRDCRLQGWCCALVSLALVQRSMLVWFANPLPTPIARNIGGLVFGVVCVGAALWMMVRGRTKGEQCVRVTVET